MATLDQAIAEAYASAPQTTIVLHALEINHRAFTQPCRIVRWPISDNEPTKFRLTHEIDAPFAPEQTVEYLGVPFTISLPENSENSPGAFDFRVDNVGDMLDSDLEAAALYGGKIECIYREYIKGDPSAPRAVWHGISIKNPRMEGTSIVAQGAVLEWLFKPFGTLYTPDKYPALVRGR